MKTMNPATKIVLASGLAMLGIGLAPSPASAGLFHRRTVVVQSPTVYVVPTPTVYAAPVSTVIEAPATAVYAAPVVDSLVLPTEYVPASTAYVPATSTRILSAPATTTYLPTVSTVPSVVVPPRRVKVIYPRRVNVYGY